MLSGCVCPGDTSEQRTGTYASNYNYATFTANEKAWCRYASRLLGAKVIEMESGHLDS